MGAPLAPGQWRPNMTLSVTACGIISQGLSGVPVPKSSPRRGREVRGGTMIPVSLESVPSMVSELRLKSLRSQTRSYTHYPNTLECKGSAWHVAGTVRRRRRAGDGGSEAPALPWLDVKSSSSLQWASSPALLPGDWVTGANSLCASTGT